MRQTFRNSWDMAAFFIALPLQILFIYAAVSKIFDMEKFSTEVGQSPLLTYFVGVIVIAVPVAEIGAVLLLFFPKTRVWGMYMSLFLMVSFTAYVFVIMHFAAYVPCSCGGILSNMNWSQHLTFNLVFTVLALIGVCAAELSINKQVNHRVYLPVYLR